jgi:hypothetical protein
MKAIALAVGIMSLMLIAACNRGEKELARIERTNELELPPGGVRIDTNLYIDETEISNFSYLEFLFWNKQANNKKYNALLPDTASWVEEDSMIAYVSYYFRHPAYRDYPIVGISYEQGQEFCKWRSDRVMEFILIREGIISRAIGDRSRQTHNLDSMFTIEKYFTGKFYGIQPNPYLKWYPEFALPDTATYQKALKLADSVNVNRVYKKKQRKDDFDPLVCNCLENAKKVNWSYLGDTSLLSVYNRSGNALLYHLRGNARELTDIKGLAFGGSWRDSCRYSEKDLFQHYDSTDAHTGFRNMCRWNRWPGL